MPPSIRLPWGLLFFPRPVPPTLSLDLYVVNVRFQIFLVFYFRSDPTLVLALPTRKARLSSPFFSRVLRARKDR